MKLDLSCKCIQPTRLQNLPQGCMKKEWTSLNVVPRINLVSPFILHDPPRFHTDPSGTFVSYGAKAIGSGSEGAETALQEEYHSSMTLVEAETLALKVLKQVMEEKLNSTNVQLASVTKDGGFQIYAPEKLQQVVDRL